MADMTPTEVLEAVDNWTLLQINEFVEAFCEKYNVSASAPVAVAAGPAAGGGEAAAEEKDEFTVVLAEVGAEKIKVIKAIREINPSLGLKEAKAVADGAPSELATDVPKAEAEEMVKKLAEVGAKAELK